MVSYNERMHQLESDNLYEIRGYLQAKLNGSVLLNIIPMEELIDRFISSNERGNLHYIPSKKLQVLDRTNRTYCKDCDYYD